MKLPKETEKALIESIARKMAPSSVKCNTEFELNCYTYEGIDAIKEVLMTAKKEVNDEKFKVDVKIYYRFMNIKIVQDHCSS